MQILHRHEIAVLNALKSGGKLGIRELLAETGLGRDEAGWAVENLLEKGLVTASKKEVMKAELTEEGRRYGETSLPEEQLLKRTGNGTVYVKDLKGREEQIGLLWSKKKGLVLILEGKVKATDEGLKAAEEGTSSGRFLRALIKDISKYGALSKANASEAKEMAERHLLSVTKRVELESVEITKAGKNIDKGGTTGEEISMLTKEMLINKKWQGKSFVPYNIKAEVEGATPARLNVLRRTINEIRQAYLGMGFVEVSGPIVEPSFWVFDHLFMPQDHPARDVQDTFFLETPREIPLKERELVGRMKKAHEKGWHIDWKENVASEAVLRTHATSVTGRYIHKIVQDINKDPNMYSLPVKLFTVGRVFRNENLDYKHLADFYHSDGIIIGRNLTMANLFDTLTRIYKSVGIDIIFKPSYYPFVEPGAHVFMKYDDEWLEMGGSGIIRREIVGVSRKIITVLAWGLGVDRVVLYKNRNVKSIGSAYNASVGWLRDRSRE